MLSSANGHIVENGVYSGDVIEVSGAGDVNRDGYDDIVWAFQRHGPGPSLVVPFMVLGSSSGIGYMNTGTTHVSLRTDSGFEDVRMVLET